MIPTREELQNIGGYSQVKNK